jgi:hypothetical protein
VSNHQPTPSQSSNAFAQISGVIQRSAQSVLTKEMREAITRAGYLMEQRLVPTIEKFGFKVTPNRRYHEPASGEVVDYLHRHGRHSGHGECRVDVVEEAGLRRLLHVIETEGKEIEKRVRRHRALLKKNVLRLAKELVKQKVETPISRLSAADKGAEESDGN